MTNYVGIIPAALDALADKHGLRFTERAVLERLLLLVDYRTGGYRCTIRALADRIGLHEKNLRPHLDRLAEIGLIDRHHPRGHEGTVTVSCYLEVVHLTPSQRANHPLHNGRFLRSETALADSAATGETPRLSGRIAASEQGIPVWSVEGTARGALDGRENGDTTTRPDRRARRPPSQRNTSASTEGALPRSDGSERARTNDSTPGGATPASRREAS